MSISPKCCLALLVAIVILQPTANAQGQDALTSNLSSADMTTLALWVKILFTSGIVVAWVTLCGILWISTKHPENPIFLQVVSKGLIVNLTTIALLIEAVTILGILNLLNSEAIAAILSGIAGYVLGSTRTYRPEDQ